MDNREVIYYSDELNDEFSLTEITPKVIDKNYNYFYDSCFKKFLHFFCYRIIATPIAYLYTKITFHHKIIGREKLKDFKNKGYFLFGNHTHDIGDAFMPHIMNFPKTNYTIVHPNNVSMPYLGKITPYLGAIPLPSDFTAYKNFLCAIKEKIKENNAVIIYPEAHIWPYYTKIRPFSDTSFHYPCNLNVPSFCFTNTYVREKNNKNPKIITYIDGPFYPDSALNKKERAKDLRDRIYKKMVERSKKSDFIKIKYIKRNESND